MTEAVDVSAGGDGRQQLRDLQTRLFHEFRAKGEVRQADIPREALLWLALVPVWSRELAERAGFPAGEARPEQVLRRAAEEGLCHWDKGRTEMVVDGTRLRVVEAPDYHWMDSVQRSTALERHQQDSGEPLSLVRHVALIGTRILEAERSGVQAPPEVSRWATLAVNCDPVGGAAEALRSRVKDLLADGDGGPDPGEAMRWIEAARLLEPHVGASLMAAAAWGGRQLEIYHRRAHDDRHLANYLHRPELVDAFFRLVAGDDPDRWAVHYVGAGGVGKTMLMRWIDSRWNREAEASTARVDFDYLNPDYPVLAPGLLLEKLAEDLRLHDPTGAAEGLFKHFHDLADALHERMHSPLLGASAAGDETTDPDYERMLAFFVDAVSRLPQPVVLLLDTCEELAKVSADGRVPESVVATFRILERLHKELPGLRVVFSGRRALASGGAGWRSKAALLPRRKYLRVVEVRGFTEEEAREYLTPRVPPELIPAILTRSFDEDDPDRFEWDDPSDAPAEVARYSPFDIALYADWARERGDDLRPVEILAAEHDQYVELRIVRRISPLLAGIMPAVALLGRFDVETLGAVSDLELDRFEEVVAELQDQEWIDLQRSGFLEVDRGLLPRLRDYYWKRQPDATERCRLSLVRHLAEITTTRPLSDLDRSHFNAVFQLLERDPERAAAWWDRMEGRFAEEGMSRWAFDLTGSLSDGQGAVAALDLEAEGAHAAHPLRAAVLATRAAALSHEGACEDLDRMWSDVDALADRHPTPEGARRLKWRALAGRLAATRYSIEPPSPDEEQQLVQAIDAARKAGADEPIAAAMVAAVEALVERAEASDTPPRPATAAELLVVWIDAVAVSQSVELTPPKTSSSAAVRHFAPELKAIALTLLARVYAAGGRLEDSLTCFRRAVDLVPAEAWTVQRWSDWRAPDETWARVRLELVRTLHPALLSPADVVREVGCSVTDPAAFPAVRSVDSSRLVASMLLAVLAVRVPTLEELEVLTDLAARTVPGTAVCRAHSVAPPLFAVVAEATAARGMVERALVINDGERRRAEQTRDALETALAAERAALVIKRRMRLRDEGRGLSSDLTQSTDLRDWDLLWALDGLEGPKRPLCFEPPVDLDRASERVILRWRHARWRSTYAPGGHRRFQASQWATAALPPADRDHLDYEHASTSLDGLEGHLMRSPRHRRASAATHRIDPARWWAEHPERSTEAVILHLRCAVLGESSGGVRIPDDLVARVGVRRCARLALDEGELLALRLPDRGRLLLEAASALFREAGDPVAALIAATATSICAARSGDRRGAAEFLRVAEASYRALQQVGDAALPAWETLAVTAEEPHARSLDALAPLEWRPWLVRIVASMAWINDGGAPRTRCRALAAWLGERYGSVNPDGSEVVQPAELDRWLEPRVRNLRWLRSAGAAVLAVLAMVALVNVADTLAVLLFYAAAIAAGWLIWRMATTGARYYVSVAPPRRRLRRSTEWHAAVGRVQLRWTRRLPRWFMALAALGYSVSGPVFLYRRFRWVFWGVGCQLPDDRWPHGEATRALPRAVRREFRRARKRAKDRLIPIELNVDQGASEVSWEGVLTRCAPEVRTPDDLGFSFQRTSQQRGTALSDALLGASAVTLWAPVSPEPLPFDGWRRLHEESRFTTMILRSPSVEDVTVSTGSRRTEVLHVVAPVLRTASGVRLQLGAFATTPAATRKSRMAHRGELLRADDLIQLFPDLVLCILQAPPMVIEERTAADREHAACLRRLAAELFTSGQIAAVLTLPPVPAVMANVATGEIAQSLIDRRGWTGLREAVTSAQRAASHWGPSSGDEALEAALDICLYSAGPLVSR